MHLIAKRIVLTIVTLATVVAMVAVSTLTSGAAAQQDTPPHSFNGTAKIDGNPAPMGTVVSAVVGGVAVDSVALDDAGRFFDLQVAVAGKEVSFTIGELVSAEKATSEVGAQTSLPSPPARPHIRPRRSPTGRSCSTCTMRRRALTGDPRPTG